MLDIDGSLQVLRQETDAPVAQSVTSPAMVRWRAVGSLVPMSGLVEGSRKYVTVTDTGGFEHPLGTMAPFAKLR